MSPPSRMSGLRVYIDVACVCMDHLSSRQHAASQFFPHMPSFHPILLLAARTLSLPLAPMPSTVHTNHAPPPTAQVATHHAGITGVAWPIVDGDDDTSPAPSRATRTTPCRLPPALSLASHPVVCHRCHPYVPLLPASPASVTPRRPPASLSHT